MDETHGFSKQYNVCINEIISTFYDRCKQGIDQQIFNRKSISRKLRILSPENCKQSLRVKGWKAEVTAEKKQTRDYNQNFVTQTHKS